MRVPGLYTTMGIFSGEGMILWLFHFILITLNNFLHNIASLFKIYFVLKAYIMMGVFGKMLMSSKRIINYNTSFWVFCIFTSDFIKPFSDYSWDCTRMFLHIFWREHLTLHCIFPFYVISPCQKQKKIQSTFVVLQRVFSIVGGIGGCYGMFLWRTYFPKDISFTWLVRA